VQEVGERGSGIFRLHEALTDQETVKTCLP
jgi:hypothetical protein